MIIIDSTVCTYFVLHHTQSYIMYESFKLRWTQLKTMINPCLSDFYGFDVFSKPKQLGRNRNFLPRKFQISEISLYCSMEMLRSNGLKII